MSSPSLSQKLLFFEQLASLNEDDDEARDDFDETEEQHRRKCRAFYDSKDGAVVGRDATVESRYLAPKRTRSAPTPNTEARAARFKTIEGTPFTVGTTGRPSDGEPGTSFIEETPVHPPVQRSVTNPLPVKRISSPSSSSASAMRKRKRDSSKPIPESDQIFRNLAFFYIPNDDVAPARKIRIAKARDYGAQWVKVLEKATHVIVDKSLTYKDIEKMLASSASSLIVVNEEYPIDSILFRNLLNPDQRRYRVPGYPASGTSEIPQSSGISDKSLPLKEPERDLKKWDYVPVHIAQAQSEEPSLHEAEKEMVPAQLRGSQQDASNRGETTEEISAPREQVIDELSEYIVLLQQYKDLPLDEDEDGQQAGEEAEDSGSDDGSQAAASGGRSNEVARGKNLSMEERFACYRGGTLEESGSGPSNPNAHTISVLQDMSDYYSRVNDQWRTTAYRKAIATLRRQPVRISSEAAAYALPNIGRRLAQKIEEIATTSRLRRLSYAQSDPLDQALSTFMQIYDVGTSRAARWVAQGYRSLADLRKAVADGSLSLTANQQVGLERYEDLNSWIPRVEVDALAAVVRAAAADVDSAVELLVGGSYRRGAASSHDIDFIVTKKGTASSVELAPFLDALVAKLTDQKFLVAALSGAGSGSKWHGCCVLPGSAVWRRIDFLLVPETEYGAALIYFTGNDIFNRSIRLLASKKGMRLNQRGLYRDVLRGPSRVKITDGELIEGRDEKRIFDILGVRWREPTERWC
jgi:DNA polymerase lambda/DNA polymerase IV